MSLADRLRPRIREAATLDGPWPCGLRDRLREGALWLHAGSPRGWGSDLLAPARGPRLEARWSGSGWATAWDGRAVDGPPYAALARVAGASSGPLVGALTFELACWEAGLPHKAPEPGDLGMAWTALDRALVQEEGRGSRLAWGPGPGEDVSNTVQSHAPGPCHVRGLEPAWDAARHREAVEEIRRRIGDGGFYVANLCVPFRGHVEGEARDLALAAFERARPPFGAWLDLGDRILLSLSMERALSLEGGRLRCEPIKGTCPRSGDPEADAQAAAALKASPKERAEHTMIVDLVRNDLGRVARAGTVEVAAALEVRPYGTVQHLVSAVEAEAAPGAGLADILRAVLPGGSVTGAPKHAVCRHLAAVEAAPRGFYCGALGWIAPGGSAFDLAMPIRTAELQGAALTYWAGGGITRLSDPEEEWAEVLLKARAITG